MRPRSRPSGGSAPSHPSVWPGATPGEGNALPVELRVVAAARLGFLRDLLLGRHGRGGGTKSGNEGGHVDVALHAPEALLRFGDAERPSAESLASSFQRLTLRVTRRSEPFMFSIGLVVANVRRSVPVRPRRITVSVSSMLARKLAAASSCPLESSQDASCRASSSPSSQWPSRRRRGSAGLRTRGALQADDRGRCEPCGLGNAG